MTGGRQAGALRGAPGILPLHPARHPGRHPRYVCSIVIRLFVVKSFVFCVDMTEFYLKKAACSQRNTYTFPQFTTHPRICFSRILPTGHPDHGPFYIIQGLVNAVPRFPWQAGTGVQTKVYTNMIALLCTLAQRKFPYHIAGTCYDVFFLEWVTVVVRSPMTLSKCFRILTCTSLLFRLPGVQSNDELYAGAPSYMSELSEHLDLIMAEVLKQLSALGERTEAAAKLSQTRTALDLVNQIAARLDLSPAVASFAYKLLELANKNKALFLRTDSRYFANTVEFVMVRAKQASVVSVSLRGDAGLSANAANEMIASLKVLIV